MNSTHLHNVTDTSNFYSVPGDSGSWMVRKGKLCGHIAAAKPTSAEAYMIPIETIQQEIRSFLKFDEFRMPDTSTAMFEQFMEEYFDKYPSSYGWEPDLDPRTRLEPSHLGTKDLRRTVASKSLASCVLL